MTDETKAVVNEAAKELLTDNWRIRRRVMFAALLFIAINVQYLIVLGKPDGLRENIAVALIAAGVGIIGSYVFGAVWDDNNKRSMLQGEGIVANPNLSQE